MIPEELRYTDEHAWVATKTDVLVRVGVTEYAQQQYGEVAAVRLPEVGDRVEVGAAVGEVDADDTADLYAPVSGEVVAVNDAVAEQADLLNSDPYGEGWLYEVEVDDPDALEALLDADAYQSITAA
ncbi:glycine cleavage system protein GcvH [Actinokineospora auranticolor]|uniref:Glycine cleavage system H protein n=1 Tax=Actinokineospora auranticolor TaxID=155976 RepID=A0A2S6GBE9_9PSEU|nr:glycine cleavage system protein GcvH [Actinokineospora auranticolor]PPK61226.1 glycine cleavage system H protein [Actinokineospora auranticolor]